MTNLTFILDLIANAKTELEANSWAVQGCDSSLEQYIAGVFDNDAHVANCEAIYRAYTARIEAIAASSNINPVFRTKAQAFNGVDALIDRISLSTADKLQALAIEANQYVSAVVDVLCESEVESVYLTLNHAIQGRNADLKKGA